MSLLRLCQTSPTCVLQRASRCMSSLPGSSGSTFSSSFSEPPREEQAFASSSEQSPSDMEYFDLLAPSKSPKDSGPPVGTAYPPPSKPELNPFRAMHPSASAIPKYNLYVTATRNNTIATFTRPNGNPIATISGGKVGFKGVRRSSYEAGYQCAVTVFQTILTVKETEDKMTLEVLFSGFGQGRDAMFRALMSEEGNEVRKLVSRVTDKTPIKIGGCRAKKARRL